MTSGFFIRSNPISDHHVSPFVKPERGIHSLLRVWAEPKLTQFGKRETTECYKFRKFPPLNEILSGTSLLFHFVTPELGETYTLASIQLQHGSQSVSANLISLLQYANVYCFSPLIPFGCNVIISSTGCSSIVVELLI